MSLSHFVLGEEHQPEKRTSVDNHIVKKKKKEKKEIMITVSQYGSREAFQ